MENIEKMPEFNLNSAFIIIISFSELAQHEPAMHSL